MLGIKRYLVQARRVPDIWANLNIHPLDSDKQNPCAAAHPPKQNSSVCRDIALNQIYIAHLCKNMPGFSRYHFIVWLLEATYPQHAAMSDDHTSHVDK